MTTRTFTYLVNVVGAFAIVINCNNNNECSTTLSVNAIGQGGSPVYLDDFLIGSTPVFAQCVEDGKHVIQIDVGDRRVEREIDIAVGDRLRVSVLLRNSQPTWTIRSDFGS